MVDYKIRLAIFRWLFVTKTLSVLEFYDENSITLCYHMARRVPLARNFFKIQKDYYDK